MIDDALRLVLNRQARVDKDVDFDDQIDMRQVLAARDDGRITLVDHDWLIGEPGANPLDSRQGFPPLDGQDELAGIWIEDKPRTGGAWLVPARDHVDKEREASGPKPRDVEAALLRASRLVHFGRPAAEVQSRLASEAGPRVARAAAAALREEEGLAGRVYVREASFPGLRQGRWDKQLRRMAQQARYLLSNQPADGFRKFGLEVVREVPWAEALRAYGPDLRSRGVSASGSDPKEVLRRALAANPDLKPASRRVPARDPSPQRIAVKAAEKVVSPEEMERSADSKTASRSIRMAIRLGQITDAQAREIEASCQTTAEVRAAIARIAAKPRSAGVYKGEADRFGSAKQAVRNMGLRPAEGGPAPKDRSAAKLRKRVAQLLVRGALSASEARRILALPVEAAQYKGDGVHFDPRLQAARDLSLSRAPSAEGLDAKLAAHQARNAAAPADLDGAKLRKRVARMLVAGSLGADRAREILAADPKSGWRELARYLASPGMLPRVGPPQSVVQPYSGAVQRAGGSYMAQAAPEVSAVDRAIEKAAAAAGCQPADVTRYLAWLRTAMSRGVRGEVLNREAQLRFPVGLRMAAEGLAAGIHKKLKPKGDRPVPASHSPHEFAFIPDAGWNPGGVT